MACSFNLSSFLLFIHLTVMSCIELSSDPTIRSHVAALYDILLEQIYYVEVTTELLVRTPLRPL
jgi:hypothetical protein